MLASRFYCTCGECELCANRVMLYVVGWIDALASAFRWVVGKASEMDCGFSFGSDGCGWNDSLCHDPVWIIGNLLLTMICVYRAVFEMDCIPFHCGWMVWIEMFITMIDSRLDVHSFYFYLSSSMSVLMQLLQLHCSFNAQTRTINTNSAHRYEFERKLFD